MYALCSPINLLTRGRRGQLTSRYHGSDRGSPGGSGLWVTVGKGGGGDRTQSLLVTAEPRIKQLNPQQQQQQLCGVDNAVAAASSGDVSLVHVNPHWRSLCIILEVDSRAATFISDLCHSE